MGEPHLRRLCPATVLQEGDGQLEVPVPTYKLPSDPSSSEVYPSPWTGLASAESIDVCVTEQRSWITPSFTLYLDGENKSTINLHLPQKDWFVSAAWCLLPLLSMGIDAAVVPLSQCIFALPQGVHKLSAGTAGPWALKTKTKTIPYTPKAKVQSVGLEKHAGGIPFSLDAEKLMTIAWVGSQSWKSGECFPPM